MRSVLICAEWQRKWPGEMARDRMVRGLARGSDPLAAFFRRFVRQIWSQTGVPPRKRSIFRTIRRPNMEPNRGTPSKRIHFPDAPEAKYGAKPGYPLEMDPYSGRSGGQIWSQTGGPPSKWIHMDPSAGSCKPGRTAKTYKSVDIAGTC